jgi:hypothetical protein
MTREEKAYSLGQKYFPNKNNVWARPNFEAQWVSNACLQMAEWEHKRLVEKACEWLKENIDLYAYNSFSVKSGYPEITLTDTFEIAFKKSMEE